MRLLAFGRISSQLRRAEFVNGIMNRLANRFAGAGPEFVVDFHAQGRLDLRNQQMNGFLVWTELAPGDLERVFVVMPGAVLGATFKAPGFDGVVRRGFSFGLVEFVRESKDQAVVDGVEFEREMHRLPGGAYSIEATVALAVASPAVQAARVERAVAVQAAVGLVKSAAHHTGGEIGHRKLDHPALHLPADSFGRDQEDATGAVGEIQKAAFERTPFIAGDAHEFAR